MNISNVNSVAEFNATLPKLKICGYNWKADKLYRDEEGNRFSLSEITKKLHTLYSSEYFQGARLSEDDQGAIQLTKFQFTHLCDQTIQVSRKRSLYLKVIRFCKRLLLFRQADLATGLVQRMDSQTAKLDETHLLKRRFSTSLTPHVKTALLDANTNYYQKPFQDTHIRKNEAARKAQGETVHRYNHGLAHATRKTFFTPLVVDYFLRHSPENLRVQLEELIRRDGQDQVMQKLQIAAAFEVAGRESECGSRDNLEVYTSYLENSKNAFEQHCRNHDLVGEGKLFRDEEDLEAYSTAIVNKYHNRFKGEEMDALTAVLDTVHTLDEFRCYWPSRMKGEIEAINHYYTLDKGNRDLLQLAKFCQNAVRVTGDRLMTRIEDSFDQRSINFADGDLSALAYHNYRFTDENAFLQCSKDPEYCWSLLERLPVPISYSQGETTYSYMKEPAEQLPSVRIGGKAEEALSCIVKGDAAIRLVNTDPQKFGFEMNMYNDPVFFRPTRSVPGPRDWVMSDRVEGTVIQRGFKDRKALAEQMEAQEEEGEAQWGPVHFDADRGKAKYTPHSKKLSTTLLRPDAKIKHFDGEFPREFGKYHPVGFLYDVNQLHQKGQKFIFDKDVGTSCKFWVGDQANRTLDEKEGRATQLTLAELKENLAEEVRNERDPEQLAWIKMQHASNEMLMGVNKGAIQAVFATKDQRKARLRTFLHGVYLAQDYGKYVPTLIVDGKTEPRAYTKEELLADLKSLEKSRSPHKRECFNKLKACFFSELDQNVSAEDVYNKCLEYWVD